MGGRNQGGERSRLRERKTIERVRMACRGEWPNPPMTLVGQSRRGSPAPSTRFETLGKSPAHSACPSVSLLVKEP